MQNNTSINLPTNIVSFLAYLFGWFSGLIILLLEKNNNIVRFHALQSLITFGLFHIISLFLWYLPFGFYFNSLFSSVFNIFGFIIWIILMIKAYQNEKFKLPIIGDITEEYLHKIKI